RRLRSRYSVVGTESPGVCDSMERMPVASADLEALKQFAARTTRAVLVTMPRPTILCAIRASRCADADAAPGCVLRSSWDGYPERRVPSADGVRGPCAHPRHGRTHRAPGRRREPHATSPAATTRTTPTPMAASRLTGAGRRVRTSSTRPTASTTHVTGADI